MKQSRDTKHTHTHTHIQRSVSNKTKGEVGHRTVVHKLSLSLSLSLTHTHTHPNKERQGGKGREVSEREVLTGSRRVGLVSSGTMRKGGLPELSTHFCVSAFHSHPVPVAFCCLLPSSPVVSIWCSSPLPPPPPLLHTTCRHTTAERETAETDQPNKSPNPRSLCQSQLIPKP